MSTVPGHDSWRDAGLREPDLADIRELEPDERPDPDEATSLVEEVLAPDEPPASAALAEEYHPRTARPDLDGEANEADVVEQSEEVPGLGDGDDEYEPVADEYMVPDDEYDQ